MYMKIQTAMVGLLLYIWYNIPNGNLIDGIYAKSNPGLTTALNLLVVLFLRCICTDQVVSGFSFSNCGIDIQARHTLALDQCLHNPQYHNAMFLSLLWSSSSLCQICLSHQSSQFILCRSIILFPLSQHSLLKTELLSETKLSSILSVLAMYHNE